MAEQKYNLKDMEQKLLGLMNDVLEGRVAPSMSDSVVSAARVVIAGQANRIKILNMTGKTPTVDIRTQYDLD